MLNRDKIKEIMVDYPEVGQMTLIEYKRWKKEKDEKIPCVTSIYKYFGRWVEFKLYCFENPTLNRWWENENNVIQALLEHPLVQTMTELEYNMYRENNGLPSIDTIKKYVGTFNEMKNKIFSGLYQKDEYSKPIDCFNCVFEDECDYNYNLEDCPYFDN